MSSFHRGCWRWHQMAVLASVAGLGIGIGSMASAQGKTDASREADQMFQNLDTNRDGNLKIDEGGPSASGLMKNIFEMAGKQPGGTVSRAEFQAVFDKHKAGAGGRGRPNSPPAGQPNSPAGGRPAAEEEAPADMDGLPPILAQLDGNGDGRLTRSELQRLTQLFEQLDSDKDGALTAEEIRSAGSLPKSDTKPKASTKAPRSASSTSKTTSTESEDRPASKSRSSSTTGSATAGRNATRSIPAGVWRGWIVDGRGENPNSGQMEIELTVEGNRITGREVGSRRAPEGIGGGTFISTGDGRTGNLDAEGTSGPQEGRSFQGIYEFDGEVLKWCVSNRGRQRPQSMATERGNYLMVLRQQK